MALIIKGEMPKACSACKSVQRYRYSDECEYLRKPIARNGRLKDCPILGEIPDEHGRLKDESVIIENMGNAFEKLFPLDGKHKQTIVSDCHVEFMRAVFKAPTIIDATPVDKLPKEWYDPSEDGLYEEKK